MRIHRSMLAAVGAVATEANRYAINGLYLESGSRGHFTVATDGKCLIAVEGTPPENEEDRPETAVILPPETVKEALKKMGRRRSAAKDAAIEIKAGTVGFALQEYPAHVDPETARLEGRSPEATHSVAGRVIEGNYPRFRDVLPSYNGEGTRICFGIDQMLKFLKTLSDIMRDDDQNRTFELVIVDDERPALFRAKLEDGRGVIGVLMPVTSTKRKDPLRFQTAFETALKNGQPVETGKAEVVADAAD